MKLGVKNQGINSNKSGNSGWDLKKQENRKPMSRNPGNDE
jgi:hypothetical protein